MRAIVRVFLQLDYNVFYRSRRYYACQKIRNIGILAHIDAGKTTTTERMLFYAGKTRSLGEVHRGNTITDYLTQERERGITICSSAVSFDWLSHKINLLDTPGHIDFTMEVEQSLHAVDGVVVVLDSTAGVEAQTITVWSQSERHHLPKIVFMNKMDRPDADFVGCVEDLKHKLNVRPICLQYPTKDEKGNLSIYDIILLKKIIWSAGTLGVKYRLEELSSDHLIQDLTRKRNELIDLLSGEDDELADFIINTEGFDSVTNTMIYHALRRATCNKKLIPVLLGSAYKNVGIQPLMDAVVNYLPAPNESNSVYDCFENDFVGKVFKIVHDKQRGALTLVRVFRGELKRGMRLANNQGTAEVVQKIFEPLADEYREIQEVSSGDVGICSGLKHTRTGDLLTSSVSSLRNAQKRLQTMIGKNPDKTMLKYDTDKEMVEEIFTAGPQVPNAVYFCSIEPPNLSSAVALDMALKQLQREDPSLRIAYDSNTGQTVLGGMGELHMDIIKSRILTEYKIDVELGPLQIAYKEAIEAPCKQTFTLEKDIAGSKQIATITMELTNDEQELFSLAKIPENMENLNELRPRTLQAIRKAALSALDRGPRVSGQVIETQIKLHGATIGRGTAESFIMAVAAQCVQKILTTAGTRLLEPIMATQILAPAERISAIIADLSRRRAQINDVIPRGTKNKLILVSAPLAELSGYSSALRTISSGHASMTMQPCGFAKMNTADEEVAVKRAQGLL